MGHKREKAPALVTSTEAVGKTWISWAGDFDEFDAVIECELYRVPVGSESSKWMTVLHGMCPKCHKMFVVGEGSGMTVRWLTYPKTPGQLKAQWERHCREVLRRKPQPEDKIASVSSPECWMCDHCKSWCVKVTDSIAVNRNKQNGDDDMSKSRWKEKADDFQADALRLAQELEKSAREREAVALKLAAKEDELSALVKETEERRSENTKLVSENKRLKGIVKGLLAALTAAVEEEAHGSPFLRGG